MLLGRRQDRACFFCAHIARLVTEHKFPASRAFLAWALKMCVIYVYCTCIHTYTQNARQIHYVYCILTYFNCTSSFVRQRGHSIGARFSRTLLKRGYQDHQTPLACTKLTAAKQQTKDWLWLWRDGPPSCKDLRCLGHLVSKAFVHRGEHVASCYILVTSSYLLLVVMPFATSSDALVPGSFLLHSSCFAWFCLLL